MPVDLSQLLGNKMCAFAQQQLSICNNIIIHVLA